MKKIFSFISIIILLLVIFCSSHKLVFNIKNDRTKDLHKFKIIHSGQEIVIPLIRKGELKSITLYPGGGSSLAISFQVDGEVISKKFDAYFEGGAVGDFHIEIFDDTIVGHEEIYYSCIDKYLNPNSYVLLKEDFRD